jgi:hypothetical protein
MPVEEFMKQQYLTLREEIRGAKVRMFVLMVLATIFIPVSGFLAQRFEIAYAATSMPFIVLVFMLAFVMEQNSVIRAGRYLKEHVEPHLDGVVTWERWLESNRRLRDADRYFFGSVVLVFFLFYALGAVLAIQSWAKSDYPDQMWPATVAFGLGGLWFVVVLLRHWRSCTTTQG